MKPQNIALLAAVIFARTYVAASDVQVEYVQMTKANPSFILNAGEAAEVIGITNYNKTDDRSFFAIVGEEEHRFTIHPDVPQWPTVVGPCTVSENLYYPSDMITFRITRKSLNTASNDLAPFDYNKMDGWVFFTEFPWVFSNTNQSWYYLTATSPGVLAYNSNLPGDGWMSLLEED